MKVIDRDIVRKDEKFVCYADEGVCRMDITGDMDESPSISNDQALKIAEISVDLEEFYGAPQDIEWAIESDGRILILQCRPLQQLADEETFDSEDDLADMDELPVIKDGFTASPGVGTGSVFVLRKEADQLRFPDGAVLVTSQALPRWAVLLNRASAVITEQVSITGHLANVAREFEVPAIFGLENAVDLL